MPAIRAQVSLPHLSGLPEDVTVNTWSFETTGAVPAGLDDITTALDTFYSGLGTWLSANLTGTGLIKYYNLIDPEPRVPVQEDTFSFTPGSGVFVSEVALCLSFQGERISGLPQARRRGRIYFGPLTSTVNNANRPATSFLNDLVSSGDVLLASSQVSATWKWSVWSPTDGQMVEVTDGWVDNAFDTQRRRGAAPSSRSTFS
jgi:hypothetical protein